MIVTTALAFAAKVARIVTSTVNGTARMIAWILMETDMAWMAAEATAVEPTATRLRRYVIPVVSMPTLTESGIVRITASITIVMTTE
jgi:hypothetical protein